MRKLIVVMVALVGLLGVSAVASADEPQSPNHAWFFGDCEGYGGSGGGAATGAGLMDEGCHGFGIFFGHFGQEALVAAIEDEAWDELYEEVVVVKLYAFKVGGGGTQFVPPIVGAGYGSCGGSGGSLETQNTTSGPDITGGLWIAWFTVEICDYDD